MSQFGVGSKNVSARVDNLKIDPLMIINLKMLDHQVVLVHLMQSDSLFSELLLFSRLDGAGVAPITQHLTYYHLISNSYFFCCNCKMEAYYCLWRQ